MLGNILNQLRKEWDLLYIWEMNLSEISWL